MQFTPLGPWGMGASAGPATEGLNRGFPDASKTLILTVRIRGGKGLKSVGYHFVPLLCARSRYDALYIRGFVCTPGSIFRIQLCIAFIELTGVGVWTHRDAADTETLTHTLWTGADCAGEDSHTAQAGPHPPPHATAHERMANVHAPVLHCCEVKGLSRVCQSTSHISQRFR